MNPNKDFNQNINQLIELLKKILTHIPHQPVDSASLNRKEKEMSIHFNLCFFNLLPLSGEELDELEEFYESFLHPHDEKGEELEPDLTPLDIEFLKQNGIRF